MAGRSSVEDPIKVFLFTVEADGFVRAGFSEVTGLQQATEMVEYREGGMNATPRKSPGLTSYANITLRRGQIIGGARGGDNDFLRWAQDTFRLNVYGASMNPRRTLDIVQYNRAGVEVRRWRVQECLVAGYTPMSDLNGTTNEDSIEELELAHEGFELVGGGATVSISIST